MSESNFKKQMNMPRVFFVGSVLLATLSLAGCGTTTDDATKTVASPVEIKIETEPKVAVNSVVVNSIVTSTEAATTTVAPVSNNAPTSTTTKPTIATTAFKDGTYRVIGSYNSPAGDEQLGVSVTLKNDVVVDTSVEQMATAGISKRMQADFAANYKTFVVGKKITDIHLTKVSGSSLTPAGFNDALVKIEAQAKAK